MSKEELIKECENNVHLAQAVEAKDKEISDLKAREKSQIEAVKEKLQKEIDTLLLEKENEIERRVTEIKTEMKKTEEKDKKDIEVLMKVRDRRIEELNKLLYAHGDLLKTLESTINTHLTLNGYIVQEIQK